MDVIDARDQLNELSGQNSVLVGLKRKLEGETQAMHVRRQLGG